MRTYKRVWIPGGYYFFTVNLAERNNTNLLIDHIESLRQAFRSVHTAYPFKMDAFVILPDHLHCIWKLPNGDDRFDTRWRRIKSIFSRTISTNEQISASRKNKSERGIWQRRYWEHVIRDEQDWRNHVDYIHYNPVKHGYVEHAADWSHSTFHRFVKERMYTADWVPTTSQELDRE